MDPKIQEFLDYLAAEKGFSANTLVAYQNDLRQFCDYLPTQAAGAEKPSVEEAAGPMDWNAVNKSQIVAFVLHTK